MDEQQQVTEPEMTKRDYLIEHADFLRRLADARCANPACRASVERLIVIGKTHDGAARRVQCIACGAAFKL